MIFNNTSLKICLEDESLQQNIQAITKKAIQKIALDLPIDSMTIRILVQQSPIVIEELGICGYAPNQYEVEISIDINNQFLYQNFEQKFIATLAHELHHCCRDATVGYGETLFEALISEGLACQYEYQLTGVIPIYVNHLDNDSYQRLLVEALNIGFGDYNHTDWFFGNPAINIPRWAGYDIGFRIVGDYLKRHKMSASDCYSLAASNFYHEKYVQ